LLEVARVERLTSKGGVSVWFCCNVDALTSGLVGDMMILQDGGESPNGSQKADLDNGEG
jgi:hypothetical protein